MAFSLRFADLPSTVALFLDEPSWCLQEQGSVFAALRREHRCEERTNDKQSLDLLPLFKICIKNYVGYCCDHRDLDFGQKAGVDANCHVCPKKHSCCEGSGKMP